MQKTACKICWAPCAPNAWSLRAKEGVVVSKSIKVGKRTITLITIEQNVIFMYVILFSIFVARA